MSWKIDAREILQNRPLKREGSLTLSNLERLQSIEQVQGCQVAYHVVLTKKQQLGFLLQGHLGCKFQICCDRCLDVFHKPLDLDFEVLLQPESEDKVSQVETILSSEIPETQFYSNHQIQLLELLEDQILLELEMKNICSESCQGVCFQCGQNLNSSPCHCSLSSKTDNPFAKLKQVI